MDERSYESGVDERSYESGVEKRSENGVEGRFMKVEWRREEKIGERDGRKYHSS